MRAWLEVLDRPGRHQPLLGIVIDKGWGLALLNRNQESPALGVPMSVPYSAVPLGASLMLMFLWTGSAHQVATAGLLRAGGDGPAIGTEEGRR